MVLNRIRTPIIYLYKIKVIYKLKIFYNNSIIMQIIYLYKIKVIYRLKIFYNNLQLLKQILLVIDKATELTFQYFQRPRRILIVDDSDRCGPSRLKVSVAIEGTFVCWNIV